jgi:HK97 family phage prohead protease/HK97 family phage major capsid protein
VSKDYPDSAVNNAKRALKYAEENGWGSCGTPVGKRRASQIANRESLSDDTIKRVYSFLSRHAQNADVPYDEGCGGLMYDAWGGKSMLPWAKKKVEQMEEKNESQLSELRNKYGQDVELRTAEVRAAGDDSLVIEGYAANFEQRTDLGYFKEEIARGAFDDVMEDDVRLLLNHEGAPMARTTNGTLELSIDDTGLKYRAALADTQDGRDLYKLIKRGDISQSSFAFTIAEQEWSEDRSVRKVIKMARLLDVSPVTYAAYPTTSVAARQMAQQKSEPVEETQTISEAQPEKQEVRTFEQTAEKKPAKHFKIMNFRNSNDAARYISQLEDKLANINALAETEERALTSEELEETQEIHAKLEAAEQQRDGLAKNEQRLKARAVAADAVVRSDKEAIKANAKFDFGKALREAAQGGVTGLEKEVMQEARNEASALGLGLRGDFSIPQSMLIEARNVYGVDSGQSGVNDAVTTVATEVTALVGALRSSSLLAATGATQLNGFVGDIKMPSLPTDAAEEPAEGASVTGNTGSMGSQTLSPQRIAQQMIVTKEAINQTNGNMAAVIAADFGRSIANVQDKIALNSISGVGGATALAGGTGQIVLATESGTNDLAATDAEDIRDLWAAITANGAENNTAFVFHPTTYAHLLGQANVSSVSQLIENGSIFGYNVLNSGSVPVQDLSAVNCDQLIEGGAASVADGLTAVYFGYYGDWTDLFYASWGGLDVTVDPFSGISAGTVKIVVDTFFDAKVRRSGSLGAMVMANATITNS